MCPAGHPVSCKACLNSGKRGRPGNHALTVGCKLTRCTCIHEIEVVGPDHALRNDLDDVLASDEDEHFVDQDDDEPLAVPHSPTNDVPVEIVESSENSPQWRIYIMYDTDYTALDPPASPADGVVAEESLEVRNLVDHFETNSAAPVAPADEMGAADIDAIRPNQYPHRG